MPTDFDMKDTVKDMVSVMKQTLGEKWQDMKEAAQFLKNRRERLQLMAELRISGDLSEERFNSRMEDEKLMFEAEMHAIKAMTKAMAQKTANAAIDVFLGAVTKAMIAGK